GPPAPTSSTRAALSLRCPSTPTSGRIKCREYRRISSCDSLGRDTRCGAPPCTAVPPAMLGMMDTVSPGRTGVCWAASCRMSRSFTYTLTKLRSRPSSANRCFRRAVCSPELLDRLSGEHTALRKHLFADDGRLRSFVNVYVNDRDIRQLAAQQTPVRPGDTVSIIPSIAGGTAVQGGAPHLVSLPKLSHEEILRYSRHLILPDVGVEGQRKLKAARVLLV